jgi:deoxyribodipyrimidine photolyase
LIRGTPAQALPELARAVGASAIHCEAIAAPYEQSELEDMRNAGVQVVSTWQSPFFETCALSFALQELPKVFAQFRQALTHTQVAPTAPQVAPTRNRLTGTDFSSKLSGWLASGALSARQISQCVREYEQRVGPNEGSQWLLQELLATGYLSNRLYIAGMGTDPRSGRRFNVAKQAHDHDPDQSYQKLWQTV